MFSPEKDESFGLFGHFVLPTLGFEKQFATKMLPFEFEGSLQPRGCFEQIQTFSFALWLPKTGKTCHGEQVTRTAVTTFRFVCW